MQVRKLFLEPRTLIGNTGLVPLQPIDDAAWIWHPDLSADLGPSTPTHPGGVPSGPGGEASRSFCGSAGTSPPATRRSSFT